jgi:hypothetical protein
LNAHIHLQKQNEDWIREEWREWQFLSRRNPKLHPRHDALARCDT